MTNKELAEYIGITEQTIYNWKREKPNLYKIITDFKNKTINKFSKQEQEILKTFDELTEDEKEMFLYEMKARVLRRKIEK